MNRSEAFPNEYVAEEDSVEKEPEGFVLYRLHPTEEEAAVYEQLGVKEFRSFYLSTVGRLIKKLSGESFIKGTSQEALEKAIDTTINLEALHTVGGLFMAVHEIGMFANGEVARGTASLALNVLINLYPILLQRMNRFELLKARRKKISIRESISRKNSEGLDGELENNPEHS